MSTTRAAGRTWNGWNSQQSCIHPTSPHYTNARPKICNSHDAARAALHLMNLLMTALSGLGFETMSTFSSPLRNHDTACSRSPSNVCRLS